MPESLVLEIGSMKGFVSISLRIKLEYRSRIVELDQDPLIKVGHA